MIKTGLNNERTRVCLCPSGDAVHREEAAESSVSLYDLNFLCGSPLSWILTVLFSLSVSHWACLSDLWPLQVCADWHSGSDWSLHLVCVWNHHHRGSGSSARCCFPPLSVDTWHSVCIRPVCVSGVFLPLRRHLRDGHVPQRQPRHIHVQHAVRLQVHHRQITFIDAWVLFWSCCRLIISVIISSCSAG